MRYSPLVRVIDRYVGSLLCLIFSIFHAFRRAPKDRSVKRILVIELVEMGASIMAYSSLLHIRRRYPDAEIYCLCLRSTQEPWKLLDALPPENVYAIDDRSMLAFFASIISQTRALSKKDIDLIIDFELLTRVSAVIAYLIRAKFRAGFYRYTMEGLYRGTFYDIKCAFNQNMHISKNLLALTKSAVDLSARYYNYNGKIDTGEITVPTYFSDASLRAAVRAKIQAIYKKYAGQSLIVLAPTVGRMMAIRDYPKDKYVAVVKKLLQLYPNHLVLLIGTPEHASVTAYVKVAVADERCIDFCTQLPSLRDLIELFAMSDLLISNDSGNPHFAAMVSLPSLTLFGPETPFMYGPLGKAVCLYEFFHTSPSITAYNHKDAPDLDDECLESIEPERVVATAMTIMEGKATYRTVNNEVPYLM